ncbi:unnamed protein product [Toxocara canis]|uniref:Uncharacterized protein n=1 Tax=Toxocara canis TaxID=6265 RepID=A0A183UWT2_TOXCA|nr:unnamed protein product [Toxocara canis]
MDERGGGIVVHLNEPSAVARAVPSKAMPSKMARAILRGDVGSREEELMGGRTLGPTDLCAARCLVIGCVAVVVVRFVVVDGAYTSATSSGTNRDG